jgi:hypothetical protein
MPVFGSDGLGRVHVVKGGVLVVAAFGLEVGVAETADGIRGVRDLVIA